jgi:hypothetical protein
MGNYSSPGVWKVLNTLGNDSIAKEGKIKEECPWLNALRMEQMSRSQPRNGP